MHGADAAGECLRQFDSIDHDDNHRGSIEFCSPLLEGSYRHLMEKLRDTGVVDPLLEVQVKSIAWVKLDEVVYDGPP